MEYSQKRKQVVKLLAAAIWTIVLPVYYAHSRRKYTCYSTQHGGWLREWCFSSYMVSVTIYLTPNAVELVLFFVPAVTKYIETSNHRICTLLSWWTQVKISQQFTVHFIIPGAWNFCHCFSLYLKLVVVESDANLLFYLMAFSWSF